MNHIVALLEYLLKDSSAVSCIPGIFLEIINRIINLKVDYFDVMNVNRAHVLKTP